MPALPLLLTMACVPAAYRDDGADVEYKPVTHPIAGEALEVTNYDWSAFAQRCDFPIENDTIRVQISESELCFEADHNLVQLEGQPRQDPEQDLFLRLRVDETVYQGFAVPLRSGYPKLAGTCVDRDGTRNNMWLVSRNRCIPNARIVTADTKKLVLMKIPARVLAAWAFEPATVH